jgi:serine/threonine-protein kinase
LIFTVESAAAMQDLSGQIIRGYELRERIGAGGFGAVYRANQISVDREVAVKIILPEHANRPEFVRRFESEARLVAQLDHLHIVPLFDFWRESDGTAFLVMRWLRGGSLRSLLKSGRLSLETSTRIIDQICRALAFAHQKGVIHRDIKPDNILLDEQRNAYLSDFGIAKDTVLNTSITTTDATPGTPAYAAPEQIGGHAVTPQTDLYALGITLYECLIGDHPFPGAPLQHLYDPLPSVSAQRNEVPKSVDDVIRRATMKKASDRFPDAITFAAALRAAVVRALPDESDGTITSKLPGGAPIGIPSQATVGITTPLVQLTDHNLDPSIPRTVTDLPPITPARREAPIEQSALLIHSSNDVPLRADMLIGRDHLLDEINMLLDRNVRVLLQGLGGMGKTTLAAETAARRADAGKLPVVWLRAGGDDPTQLLTAIARPFNAHQTVAVAAPEQQAQTVRGLLIEHEVKLVVLDDVWDGAALKQVTNAIPQNIPVLITSRQRFPVGKILDVGELMLSQALELLNYHAAEAFTLEDKDAVRLCERLGCHPFTVEIAGKTLQVDGITPAELIERIAESPHLLEMPEGYAEQGRGSVKELLNDSVFALDTDSRAVFLAFGALFAASATPELMALIMERDEKFIDDTLISLLRRGLTRRERYASGSNITYFSIHDLAFSYARENAVVPRSEVIKACHAYAEAHKNDLNALDVERSNILKAAEAAHLAEDSESLIAIMRALTVDGAYFNARGYDALMLSALDRAVEAARSAGDPQAATLHYFLSRRGNARYYSNDLSGALVDYKEALDLSRALGMPDREVILHCVISKIHSDQKDFDAAETELECAREIAEGTGDDGLMARVLEQRGYHYAEAKRDFENARQTYTEQVALAERSGSTERLFFALQNLGVVEYMLEDYPASLPHLERSLALARKTDNRLWIAHALAPLGTLYDRMGERDKAQFTLDEALEVSRQIGNLKMASEIAKVMSESGYTLK